MSETRSLVKKLAQVMKEVTYIERRGYNQFHRYKYATEADVADKVRTVLADNDVVMMPSVVEHSIREVVTRKGNTEYIAMVLMEFEFIDGESGESIKIRTIGEGQDAGDKGVYKAMTGAAKYALMKAFLIPTGDDPEMDSGNGDVQEQQKEPTKKPPPKKESKSNPRGAFFAQLQEWAKANVDYLEYKVVEETAKAWMRKAAKVDSLSEIKESEWRAIVKDRMHVVFNAVEGLLLDDVMEGEQ